MRRAVLCIAVACLGSGISSADAAEWSHSVEVESRADREASSLYEEALHAEALGKKTQALELAMEAHAASPRGKYAAAIGRLIDRLTAEMLVPPLRSTGQSPIGSRVAYDLSGTLIGAVDGAFVGYALSFTTNGERISSNGAVITGLTLLGAAVGVTTTLLTAGSVYDGSAPLHLWAGTAYGAWLASAGLLLAGTSSGNLGASYGIALAAGSVLGALLATTTPLTAGDATAAIVLGNLLAGEALAFEATSASNGVMAASILSLSTIGFIGGEILNTRLHWSAAHWGVMLLSTVLGAGLGAIIGAAAQIGNQATAIGTGIGSLIGFGGGFVATYWMSPEGPRATASPREVPEPGSWTRAARPTATFAWIF